jgi:hypothetical protein
VPVVTDPDRAQESPELTVLSALTHAHDPDHYPVLDALLIALNVVDHDLVDRYYDLVLAALPAAARHHLEERMSTTYRSEFMRNLAARAKAETEAQTVLTVLDARGVVVPDEIRARIVACTDVDLLDTWVRRAATATSIEDLFTED